MALVTGNANITSVSTPTARLLSEETSAFRKVRDDLGVSFYEVLAEIGQAAAHFNGLTASSSELNTLHGGATATGARPLPFAAPAAGSYGVYLQHKRIAVTGSYWWKATGFTHILGGWCSLSSATSPVAVSGMWPQSPSRIVFKPTLNAATQLYVQHLSARYTATTGAGTPIMFSTPVFTDIYALGY